ncbi:Pectinesterase inhibitor 11 [Linum grandiflorum]
MAKLTFPLLLISILITITITLASASNPTQSSTVAATNFIKSSCRTTTYPALCVQSLLSYAPTIQRSPRQLAQAALAVSLSRAQSTSSYVRKLARFKGLRPREAAAIKDCKEEIEDTVDRLSKSIKELKMVGRGGGPGFEWHVSNVVTWVSAALTNENTCVDGFGGKALNGRMKDGIRGRFRNTVQVTSNALALINKFAKH